MPVTMNFGLVLPAWFDVLELGTRNYPKDGWPGMLHSVRRVRQILIDEIASGTPPERIIIAGFSQGMLVPLSFFWWDIFPSSSTF